MPTITRQQADGIDVPIEKIYEDIDDTQREINEYEKEIFILMGNPVYNKTRIYLNQGQVSLRKDFIRKLQCLLAMKLDLSLMEKDYV